MTILEKTPTRLTLQAGPNGGKFFIAVFMLVISGFMLIGPQSTVFTCQRHDDGTGECILNEYRLIGSSQLSFKLEAIQAVTIETSYTTSRGQSVTIYELILKTSTGKFKLSANNLQTQQYQSAERINAFLQDTTQRGLEIKPNAGMDFLPFGLIFMAMAAWQGGVALLVSTLTFDRATAQLTITHHWLMKRAKTYPLAQVGGTRLVVTPASRQQRETKSVHIQMKSGELLPTALPYEDGLMPTIRAYLEPEFPAAPAKPKTVQSSAPAPQPAHRVKYRRAKRTNHDQPTNS
jgi:hypothetical protein